KVFFRAAQAEQMAQTGDKVILCRIETSPEDIHGMHGAQGTLTTRGGMTSHAAGGPRGMGRAFGSGAGDIRIDYKEGTLSVRGRVLKAGDIVTIDGSTGEIMVGEVPTKQPEPSGGFATPMSWAHA